MLKNTTVKVLPILIFALLFSMYQETPAQTTSDAAENAGG
jgi:hypothetical protein